MALVEDHSQPKVMYLAYAIDICRKILDQINLGGEHITNKPHIRYMRLTIWNNSTIAIPVFQRNIKHGLEVYLR